VNVVAHPDSAVAQDLAAPGLFSFARFSAMHGAATGALDEGDRRLIERIPGRYDMNRHFRRQESQAEVLTPEFAGRFGAVGRPDECATKLAELAALGLDRLLVVGPSFDADPGARAEAEACFMEEVAPALRVTRA
jgi:5,10-methylenetetrahydromethanopterin reductase